MKKRGRGGRLMGGGKAGEKRKLGEEDINGRGRERNSIYEAR